MNTKKFFPVILLVIVSLISLSVIWANAQENEPPREPLSPDVPDSHSNYIPIQGRLTDASGNPLNGSYTVTFRLYDVSTGGTALCEAIRTITVNDGLFSTYFGGSGCSIDGRQLYLGIEVGDDGEMIPRQYVDNVPIAWTLRPGALISDTLVSAPILEVENYANNGIAFRAGGSGIIQSAAPTYLWISGNGVHPYRQSDSTIIDMDTIGGALIYRGATPGNKNVMLPITLPGTLYGQNVRVSGLDLYWQGDTDFDAIAAVLMRRQTGVCNTSSCYVTILYDPADHVCDAGNNPTGCVLHYDLTTNNVLTDESGILYLTIEFGFSGASTWIDLGGVRLTLEYDN